MDDWYSREQALRELGVAAQTLYAYVSRGMIARRADPADPRRSQYRSDDIAALTQRRARGRRPAAIAASTIAWGEPVIDTAISTVVHGRLIYRGQDATTLAATAPVEDVARLLWQGDAIPALPPGAAAPDPFVALAALVGTARALPGRSHERRCTDAAAAIAALGGALGASGEGPLHRRLARGWGLDPSAADVVRRALVLLADHELNASTFAARVAASTGAPMAACLLAGLSALSGPRHGRAGAATAALAQEADARGAGAAVARWLADHRVLPGFGHPLYPLGDPRAATLLDGIALDPALAALRDAAAEACDAAPNVDFALLAMTRALALPEDSSFCLFALGRSIGWAAHVMEQAMHDAIIRPRARYAGARVRE
ncbi:citrate synthase [Sphingomonas adhaesiva]|uniref:citrate synthase n=1 Tax=Sphingomonas adhaesiva TaxID=28212 RepID=UPI002FF6F8E2